MEFGSNYIVCRFDTFFNFCEAQVSEFGAKTVCSSQDCGQVQPMQAMCRASARCGVSISKVQLV